MAVSNIDSQTWGNALQTVYDKGFRVLISRDIRDWEFIKRHKVDDRMALNHKFEFMNGIGIASVQAVNAGTFTSFPTHVAETLSEYTATFKEKASTVEIAHNVFERIKLAKDAKYGDVLAQVIENRLTGLKRVSSIELHGDGTGVIGEVGATAQSVAAADVDGVTAGVRFYLKTASESNTAKGAVGMFQPEDILVLKSAAGSTSALNTNLGTEPVYWRVVSRRRSDDSVLLQGQSAVGTATAAISSISTPAAAGEVFYRYAQAQFPDHTSTISDYGTATEAMPGLETLTASDGRVVHGITMSGSAAGTRLSAGAVTLNSGHLEDLMNDVKIAVGAGQYNYKMALCAPEARSILIKSGEGDRRFSTQDNIKRGSKDFTYQHEDSTIVLQSSEFCPKNRLYVLPESKAGDKSVVEYWGTDFTAVADGSGNTMHLKSGSSGYSQAIVSYMKGYGTLICKHPAAVGVLTNFLVS